jgi:hypothetical protein
MASTFVVGVDIFLDLFVFWGKCNIGCNTSLIWSICWWVWELLDFSQQGCESRIDGMGF